MTIVFLLVFTAIISALETAFMVASRAKLQNLIRKGNKKAVQVEKLRKNISGVISTLLVGETFFEVALSSLSTVFFVEVFGDFGPILSTVLMGLLIIIYGEVLPKMYAYKNSEKITLSTVGVVGFFVRALLPLVKVADVIAKFTLKFFGKNVSTSDESENLEELKGAISLHATMGRGHKAKTERLMLESVLDLDELDVDEVMTHRKNVTMIDADLPMDAVLQQVLSSPYTRHPVWKGNRENIIGILHTKDLLRAIANHQGRPQDINVVEASSAPWFIPESTSLLAQLSMFKSRKEHLACVVDEYGALLGIITLEDILEEIVGEIDDEHDVNVSGFRREGPHTISVHGWVTLRDLNREFDWNLPDENAATIAGLIIHETRCIPNVGQEFIIHGMSMKILGKKRNQITRIRIKLDMDIN